METTATLFVEIPDLHLHYDPTYDSLYIVGSCHFRLYLFSNKDFAAPLFHPAFGPVALYSGIPLHVAHPAPPATPAAPIPASPLQAVPDILLSPESDPSEVSGSSSSSSGPSADYSPAGPGMTNGYMTE